MSAPLPVSEISRARPECGPWLALVHQALEADASRPLARVGPATKPPDDRPRLAGATIAIDIGALRACLSELLETAAAASAKPRMAVPGIPDALALLEAAIAQDGEALTRLAVRTGIDEGVLLAVAPVAAMPVLQAHRRAWEPRVSPAWVQPFCPVCGAWPGLAEVRGLDRTRRFRCLRCASEWPAAWLSCPYCGNCDHVRLGSLVAEDTTARGKAETCEACRGYVKTVTVLQACDPAGLVMLDVDTIELDLAAVQHGYHRPERLAWPLGVRVEAAARGGRWWWRR